MHTLQQILFTNYMVNALLNIFSFSPNVVVCWPKVQSFWKEKSFLKGIQILAISCICLITLLNVILSLFSENFSIFTQWNMSCSDIPAKHRVKMKVQYSKAMAYKYVSQKGVEYHFTYWMVLCVKGNVGETVSVLVSE